MAYVQKIKNIRTPPVQMESHKRNIDDNNNSNYMQQSRSLKISKHNHDSNITTIDNYFYLIWRNKYTRRCIRNIVLENRDIKLDIEYLNNNYKYLSLLSDKDKIEYNIFIRLEIGFKNFKLYSKNSYKHLINSIHIRKHREKERNSDLFHEGLVKVKIDSHNLITFRDNLPQSLMYLDLSLFECPSGVDRLILHLPSNLKVLELPPYYLIQTKEKIILPPSLEVLKYETKCSELKKLVVPPSRVYRDVKVFVCEPNDLQWLHSQYWLRDVYVNILFHHSVSVPSHIKRLSIHFYEKIMGKDHPIPKDLESLKIVNTIGFPINFLSDMPYLKDLHIDWDIKFEKGIMPPTLESLIIYRHNHPIEHGVLPPGLTELHISQYNQELQVGVLPLSLKKLILNEYNQHLKPFVLPNRLEYLSMKSFKGSLEHNVLPTSLTRLELPHFLFQESFKRVDQLNNLRYLFIYTLRASLARVISNCKSIELKFQRVETDFNLRDAQIEQLTLIYHQSIKPITLEPSFIPSKIKSLTIDSCLIESNDVVPRSCLYLYSRKIHLNTSLIPSTTKYVQLQ